VKNDAPAAASPQATLTDLPPVESSSDPAAERTDVTSKSLDPVAPTGTQEVEAPPASSSATAVVLSPVVTRAPVSRARPGPARWVPIVGALGFLALGAGLFLLDASGEAASGELTELLVSSNPPGAMVTLDGRPLSSRTPFSIEAVATDRSHLVIIDLPGHVRWTQRVKLTPGAANKVHAVLQTTGP